MAENETIATDEEALADKKLRRRLWSMGLFMAILAVPIFIAAWRFWGIHRSVARAEAEAQAELAQAQPKAAAYGVLGSIRLDQGRLEEALSLLQKASVLERAAKQDTQDTLTLAKAQIKAFQKGLAGATEAQALATLKLALELAQALPTGKQAATFFSVGLFFRDLGHKHEAVQALQKAVALQPDDWVDQGGGKRYKSRGLASYYQKMLAAAEMD